MALESAVLRFLGDGAFAGARAGAMTTHGSVVVIGNFDGVHLGHQAVLREAVGEARARGCVTAVLTFDPHPAGVLGRTPPPTLTTIPRKAELMGALGVDVVYVRRFDLAFAACSPEEFARTLLAETLAARVVVVGDNFRFGAKRSGDLATLRALGVELGFEARPHAMAQDARGAFSSTRAREAVRTGDLGAGLEVLGRPHSLSGVVVHGHKRGRTIGFPTANLAEVAEILPPDGVYAVQVEQLGNGGARPLAGGVMNIGVRPTVGGDLQRTIEAHLFDFDRDLYGAALRVQLIAFLRGEKKFAGLDALKAQIAADACDARARLGAAHTA